MKAVISIIVGETDKYSELEENKENYSHITWDMVNEMMESGLIEIQNHTYNLHKTGKPNAPRAFQNIFKECLKSNFMSCACFKTSGLR